MSISRTGWRCTLRIRSLELRRGRICGGKRAQDLTALVKAEKQIQFRRTSGGRHLVSLSGREIETRGLADGFWTDLYHRSMTVHWPVFFATAAAIFIILNTVFAFLYLLVPQ